MKLNVKTLLLVFGLSLMFVCGQGFFVEKLKDKITNIVKTLTFKDKCLGDLGCFNNGKPFFHPILRPLSLLPWDLKDINTKFWLFTPATGMERTLLEPNSQSLNNSPYDKELSLKILIHGYMTNYRGGDYVMNRELIEALVNTGRHNVILVDWTDSNWKPYPQAIANGRVVGAQIAKFVEFLQKKAGLDPQNVHIIGHSLGSHVAGWAGKRIPKLGRLTGLDPAGPYFRKTPAEARLDAGDADYVDVIHTNAANTALKGLGISEPIGDLDFYPNGGKTQPGCDREGVYITTDPKNETVDFKSMGCDHFRVLQFYTESITNEDCEFVATECRNYKTFQKGGCNGKKTAIMGYHSEKVNGLKSGSSLFLYTSDKAPYCKE